jgi:hypothetical protein
MEMFLSGKMSATSFCDDFYYSYDLEIDYDSLTSLEKINFQNLSEVAGRFSEFKEDHENYPGVFYTERELYQKVLETKENLKDYNL